VGPFGDAVTQAFARRVELCIEQTQALRIANLAGWERIRIGGAEEIADADKTLPPILLDVPIARPAGNRVVRISLRATMNVSPQRNMSIRCLARNTGARPRDFLEGFLGAMALAAVGETASKGFDAIVIGAAQDGVEPLKLTRRLPVPTADKAREYLASLAADLFSGSNHYFLPIEAVEAVLKKTGGRKAAPHREIRGAIEDLRDNEWHPCSSDYGPIRNARTYGPPPSGAVLEIMRRRFDPIKAIFGK
jgi:hypothetical protein